MVGIGARRFCARADARVPDARYFGTALRRNSLVTAD
jgi:hypothetical protein